MSGIRPDPPVDADCPDGVWAMPPRFARKKKTQQLAAPSVSIATGNIQQAEPTTALLPGKQAEVSADDKKQQKRSMIVSFATLVLSIPALIGAWCWPAIVIGLVSGTVTTAARHAGHLIGFSITLAMMLILNAFMFHQRKKRRNKPTWWQRNGPFTLCAIAAVLIMMDPSRHIVNDNVNSSAPDWRWTNEFRSELYPGTVQFDQKMAGQHRLKLTADIPHDQFFSQKEATHLCHKLCANSLSTVNRIVEDQNRACDFFNLNTNTTATGGQYECELWNAFASGVPAEDKTQVKLVHTPGWISQQNRVYSECPVENMSCLSLTGWLVTVGCTYSGFACLILGTLWNADIKKKLKEIRAQWHMMRHPEEYEEIEPQQPQPKETV